MILQKKPKPFVQLSNFEIVVGTIDSAAKDLELQLQRQQQLLKHNSAQAAVAQSVPMGTFPSAPNLTRPRDRNSASSLGSFRRNNPPPPFAGGSSTPEGISLAGGPPPQPRTFSQNSRISIRKSLLAAREEALLPSAPPESSLPELDASAPPLNLDPELDPSVPTIQIPSIRTDVRHIQLASATDEEQYLASLQSRISAPTPAIRPNSLDRIRRRPLSSEIEEASAPPLDEDNMTVSERMSVASALPLYTE